MSSEEASDFARDSEFEEDADDLELWALDARTEGRSGPRAAELRDMGFGAEAADAAVAPRRRMNNELKMNTSNSFGFINFRKSLQQLSNTSVNLHEFPPENSVSEICRENPTTFRYT